MDVYVLRSQLKRHGDFFLRQLIRQKADLFVLFSSLLELRNFYFFFEHFDLPKVLKKITVILLLESVEFPLLFLEWYLVLLILGNIVKIYGNHLCNSPILPFLVLDWQRLLILLSWQHWHGLTKISHFSFRLIRNSGFFLLDVRKFRCVRLVIFIAAAALLGVLFWIYFASLVHDIEELEICVESAGPDGALGILVAWLDLA